MKLALWAGFVGLRRVVLRRKRGASGSAAALAAKLLGWCRCELQASCGPSARGAQGGKELSAQGQPFTRCSVVRRARTAEVPGHRDVAPAQGGQGDGAVPSISRRAGRSSGPGCGLWPPAPTRRRWPQSVPRACAPRPILQVPDHEFHLGVAAVVGFQFEHGPSRSVMNGWYSYLANKASWLPGVGFTRRTMRRGCSALPGCRTARPRRRRLLPNKR